MKFSYNTYPHVCECGVGFKNQTKKYKKNIDEECNLKNNVFYFTDKEKKRTKKYKTRKCWSWKEFLNKFKESLRQVLKKGQYKLVLVLVLKDSFNLFQVLF